MQIYTISYQQHNALLFFNYLNSAKPLPDCCTYMRRMLLIVDPQTDFITGTLAVDGAREAMDSLAGYIMANDGKYCVKAVTADCHPANHISFIENGGKWHAHCIDGTTGASIWRPVMSALHATSGETVLLKKGTRSDREEYSIFKNEYAARTIKDIVRRHDIEVIDLCGIAGDVCVLDTLKDGRKIFGRDMLNVLTRYSPSIDGGAALAEAINS